jgi:hypothetical protein
MQNSHTVEASQVTSATETAADSQAVSVSVGRISGRGGQGRMREGFKSTRRRVVVLTACDVARILNGPMFKTPTTVDYESL